MFLVHVAILSLHEVMGNSAKINGTASSFFALPGTWVGDSPNAGPGPQPSTNGFTYLELDTDYSAQGYISSKIMLQICDGRDDCNVVQTQAGADSVYKSEIDFFKRDPDKTAYIHLSRCSDGVVGSTVQALSGGSYKMCTTIGGGIVALASYKLPPNLCETSCDKNSKCTMYTVDSTGQNCWLSTFDDIPNRQVFIKVK